MKTLNIIGDIAGRFDELILLLKKMPPADLTIAVGDLMDRGPKSKQVIEYFMNTPNTLALYGNHEDLMVNAVENFNTYLWYVNGGTETVLSYGMLDNIPQEHISWLKTLPLYFENDEVFVSHAPLSYPDDLPGRFSRNPRDIEYFTWNRQRPKEKYKDKFMIYGHNGRLLDVFTQTGEIIAKCIDNSHVKQLVGIHWPTKELFCQEYLFT